MLQLYRAGDGHGVGRVDLKLNGGLCLLIGAALGDIGLGGTGRGDTGIGKGGHGKGVTKRWQRAVRRLLNMMAKTVEK